VTEGTKLHVFASVVKSLLKSVLSWPKVPVRLMVGKNAARAAPLPCRMWRFHDLRARSAFAPPIGGATPD
jgi:hypothetical protein